MSNRAFSEPSPTVAFPASFPARHGPGRSVGAWALAVGLLAGTPASAGGAPPEGVPHEPERPAQQFAVESDEPVVGDPTLRNVYTDRSLPPRLAEALKDILNDAALDGTHLGFFVYDVEADRTLASVGEDLLLNPASNAKLLTAAAALKILRPDFRWKTEYFLTAPIVSGVVNGDLVVKGYGDPSVVTERLQGVADELYLMGVRRILGRVIVDDSYFDRVEEPRGWEMEEAPDRAYAAPVSGLSVNYNAIGVHIRPGLARGQPAVATVDPPVEHAVLDSQIQTGRWSRWLRVTSDEDRAGTKLTVTGIVGSRDRPRVVYRRVYDPPRYFGSLLVHCLNERGVKVKHRILRGPVPAGAVLVHVDHSPRLAKVITDLNHYSNNFIAETVVKTMGAETTGRPGTFDDGLAAVRRFLEAEVGYKDGQYTYGNGSGLNDVNRVTARQLVVLLDRMAADYEVGPEFTASLAVAGTQGTIRSRMRDGPAERRLRAKTGTLTGVSALSGYVVDPRNRLMAFSILVMGWSGETRTADIWEVQNRIGEALASDGESWAPELDEPTKVEEVAARVP